MAPNRTVVVWSLGTLPGLSRVAMACAPPSSTAAESGGGKGDAADDGGGSSAEGSVWLSDASHNAVLRLTLPHDWWLE